MASAWVRERERGGMGEGQDRWIRVPVGDDAARWQHRAPSTLPPVFGLAPDWLLPDGVPVADALVLSHPEQFDRLAAACPEALPTAVLAGDPVSAAPAH
ncbi:hypothetical protein ACIBQ3_14595 [Streptomyces rubiginosohelvolus]|uniref:hypothetical protein n=1 Tax=Streptomyces rubiginosohelvolus TaxID=67362 RepID=UPI003799DE6A